MAKKNTYLTQTGEEVQVLLDKIEDWVLASREDILALFYGIAENGFDGTVLVLGTGNYFDGSAIVFTDNTTFSNNTINLA